MKITDKPSEIASTTRFHFTSDELREWLQEYDAAHGWYPEHAYEGASVYEFIINKIADKNYSIETDNNWDAEVELKVMGIQFKK